MAIMEISIVPIGTKTHSLSRYIVDAVKICENSGLNFQVCPMSTVVEGELPELLALARSMHEEVFRGDTKRVVTTIKIDDRRDFEDATMEKKVKSLKEKLKYKK
jgi:uncharacterized protein (TIGR00106 family)